MSQVRIITDEFGRAVRCLVGKEDAYYRGDWHEITDEGGHTAAITTMLNYALIVKECFSLTYGTEDEWKQMKWDYRNYFGPEGVDPYAPRPEPEPEPVAFQAPNPHQ